MLADLDDLEAELGRSLADDELPKALRALRFASNLATSLAPWSDWDPVPEIVADAVAALAARRFNARNDGLAAIGPFRYETGASLVEFTVAELGMLGVGGISFSISIATPDP